jgi:hypothetical protein
MRAGRRGLLSRYAVRMVRSPTWAFRLIYWANTLYRMNKLV